MERMTERNTGVVRQLSNNRAEEMQFGRWLGNEKVTSDEIMEYSGRRIAPLVADRHVLAIQDTSEMNYQKHAGRITNNVGTVGNGTDIGLFLHPVLVVDADEETCYGLAGARIWRRTEKKTEDYRTQVIEDKESYRWLQGVEIAKAHLWQASHVTIIADRESDIYEEWARCPDHRVDLLTRACRDRAIDGEGSLFGFTDTLPVTYCYQLDLPAIPGKRAARSANMELRFGSVIIKRPRHCTDRCAPKTITLRVVDVREIPDPSCADEPIHWRLLTTHAVDTVEMACRIVAWYRKRWYVEQLFRTLKRQGLDIEGSQGEDGKGLERLVALAVQVAARSIQLVLARNGETSQPATLTFDPEEIAVLEAVQPTLEGKTTKQCNPYCPRTLSWAAWIIARLGGWNGYASESPPGPITMKRGLTRFAEIANGWNLAQQLHSVDSNPDVCTG